MIPSLEVILELFSSQGDYAGCELTFLTPELLSHFRLAAKKPSTAGNDLTFSMPHLLQDLALLWHLAELISWAVRRPLRIGSHFPIMGMHHYCQIVIIFLLLSWNKNTPHIPRVKGRNTRSLSFKMWILTCWQECLCFIEEQRKSMKT